MDPNFPIKMAKQFETNYYKRKVLLRHLPNLRSNREGKEPKEEDGTQHKCERLYKHQYSFSTDAILPEGLLEENQYVLNCDSFCQIVPTKINRREVPK